jgi:hypothetical protein
LLWDESVVEKPESLKAEGLGSVRSSKAARLKRIKPGFYQPPGGRPICVPGFHWLCLLVLGQVGPPVLATMRWWSNRTSGRVSRKTPWQIRCAALRFCARRWGRQVLHIWDRGYAGSPWLGQALRYRVRFGQRCHRAGTARLANDPGPPVLGRAVSAGSPAQRTAESRGPSGLLAAPRLS